MGIPWFTHWSPNQSPSQVVLPGDLRLWTDHAGDLAEAQPCHTGWLSFGWSGNEVLQSWIYPLAILAWLWNITIFNGKTHYKWPFSMAMLNYQRVIQEGSIQDSLLDCTSLTGWRFDNFSLSIVQYGDDEWYSHEKAWLRIVMSVMLGC